MPVLAPPTLAGYALFLQNDVQVPASALPPNSYANPAGSMPLVLSFAIATDSTSDWLNSIAPDIYTLALYNLAADRLVQFANDQPGSTYFADLRKQFNVNQFVAGVVGASFDQGTGETLVVPEAFKHLTILDLANLRTLWGRAYLGFAQQIGSLWGLS